MQNKNKIMSSSMLDSVVGIRANVEKELDKFGSQQLLDNSSVLSLLLNSSYPLLITDADLDEPGPYILFANKGFCELTGYTREEMIGCNPRFLQGKKTDPTVIKKLSSDLRAGRSFYGSAINYRKDGTEFFMEWDIEPVRDSNGDIQFYLSIHRDVTNQRLGDFSLDYNLSKLNSVFEESPLAIAILDDFDFVINYNYKFKDLFELPNAEKFNLCDITHYEDKGKLKDNFDRLNNKQNNTFKLDLRQISKQNDYIWTRLIVRYINNEKLKSNIKVAIIEDISNDKRYMEELIEKQRELVQAQIIGKIGNFELDLETNIWTGSKNLLSMYELDSNSTLTLDKFYSLLNLEAVETIANSLRVAQTQKSSFDYNFLYVTPITKTVKYFRSTGYPVFNTDGKATKIIGVSQDISAQYNLEILQKEKNDLLETLNEITNEFLNPDLSKIDSNISKTLELVCHTQKFDGAFVYYMEQEHIYNLIHEYNISPDDYMRVNYPSIDITKMHYFMEPIAQGKITCYNLSDIIALPEFENSTKAFHQMGISQVVDVPMMSDELLVGFVGYWRRTELPLLDYTNYTLKITTQLIQNALLRRISDEQKNNLISEIDQRNKTIENQLIELNNLNESLSERTIELEETNTQKDKLFSIISHDLRGPLSGFLGLSSLIATNAVDLKVRDIMNMAASMQKSAKDITDLLENLLAWSRSQLGNITPNVIDQDVSSIIVKTISLLQLQADAKQIQITTSGVDKFFASTDSNLLNIIFRNLLNNAIKFTPNNGNINVILEKDEYTFTIKVIDSGVGISQESINRLLNFNEFTTTVGTNREKGTGLGLTLVKEYTQLLNGKLIIDSTQGNGSTFTIVFPINSSMQN